ncbi:MAG: hypothetical protein Q9178_005218 [Gyalolechia marmorata]
MDTCAWWIKDETGTSQGFDTLAYLGPSDLRNTIIIVAAIKTGYKIAGVDFMLAKALFDGIVPLLSPTGASITAELVDAMHGLDLTEISVAAPSILQDMASSPVFLENLRRLRAAMYSGGPLPPNAGNAIVSKTKLYHFMESSEMANVPTEEVERQDWEYLKFSPKLGY